MSEDPAAACLFCRIARGEIPAAIVYQDEHTLAFRDVNPQAPTHVLVIPRTHIPNANAVAAAPPGVWEPVMATAARVAAAEGRGESGYRLTINCGPDAGQSVDHLHVHVLGGRPLAWPPG